VIDMLTRPDDKGRPVTEDYEGRSATDDSAALNGTTAISAASPQPSPGPALSPVESQVGPAGAVAHLVHIILTSDDETVKEAVLALSQSRRWLAPLGLIVGAFLMLFQGVKLLFTRHDERRPPRHWLEDRPTAPRRQRAKGESGATGPGRQWPRSQWRTCRRWPAGRQ
jgi:hypothetical protein